jgi:polyhydroxybutyrate depolymerase
MTHRTSLRLAAVCGLLATIAVLAQAAMAQGGPLRERLRDRLAERVAERAGPTEPATRLAAGARITAPGRYEIRLKHAGLDRMALVHVPASWRASEPAPLVMALHGGGGGAIYQASDQNYGLITKSEQAGFIAVFPNGISAAANGLLATWNAGACCARARDENIDDVGFLRAVVADVSRRLQIQPRRVYAIGMSNGGMMSYRLACDAADVFHGIMAVAGTDNTLRCAPARPVPVLHVHARDDDRVLYEGGAGDKFRSEALVTDFVSVADTIGKWVTLNRASATAKRVLTVDGAWCDLHEAGAGGAPVKLCVTDTGGHSWPGGSKEGGANAPSTAIRANDLMWEFFSTLP